MTSAGQTDDCYTPARLLPQDGKRHARVALTVLGRFMRADKTEHPCKLAVISVTGASIMSTQDLEIDEPVIAHFDELGVLEGIVRRKFTGGFTISLEASKTRQEKLAAQLTWLINRSELDSIDKRRFSRVAVEKKAIKITLGDGRQIPGSILDISVSGASIASLYRPELGALIQVGKYQGRVMRYHAKGFGIEFVNQNPNALDERKAS